MKRRQSEDPAKKKEETIQTNRPLQGEGNYTAGRRYDQAQEEFVRSGKVDEAARPRRAAGRGGARGDEESRRGGA